MKLHLPSGLRKALLACLAALALPVTTLATGSGLFGIGSAVSFLIGGSQVAEAVFEGPSGVEYSDDEAYATAGGGLTWNGGNDGVWGENVDSWSGGEFANEKDVIFEEAQAGTVQLQGNIVTGNMTVTGGEWTFEGEGSDSLTVSGELALEGSASIIYSAGGTFTLSTVSGTGSITVDSGVLDISRLKKAQLSTEIDILVNLNGSGQLKVGSGLGDLSGVDIALVGKITDGMKYLLIMSDNAGDVESREIFSTWIENGKNLGQLSTGGHELSYDYSASTGHITFYYTALDLEWAGAGALAWEQGVTGWKDNDAAEFASNDNVSFLDEGSNHQVQLTESITAGNVSVQGDYAFSLSGHDLSMKSLVIATEKAMTISGSGTVHADKMNGSGTLVLNGGVLDLTGTTSDSGKISIEIGLTGSGQLKLTSGDFTNLESALSLTFSGKAPSYTLFAEGSYKLREDQLQQILHTELQYTYDADTGILTFTDDGLLVWVNGDGVWSTESTNAQWKNNGSYVGGGEETVFFGEEAGASGTVTLGGRVEVAEMTVAYGNFTFALGGNTLETGTLTVNKGASMSVSGEVSLTTDRLRGEGSITYQGGATLTLGDATGFTGTLNLTAKGFNVTGDLEFGSGGKIVVTYASSTMGDRFTVNGTLTADVDFNVSSGNQCLQLGGGTILGNVTLLNNTFFQGADGHVGGKTASGAKTVFDMRGYTLDMYSGGSMYIDGSIQGLSAINFSGAAGAKLYITADIDENSLQGTTITLGNRGSQTAGAFSFDGSVSGVGGFTAVNGSTANQSIYFTSSLEIKGETTFAGSSDKSAYELTESAELSGDSSAKIIKQGSCSLTLNGDLSEYEGGLKMQAGTLNVNSDATFSGVELSGGTLAIAANKSLTLANGLSSTGGTLSIGSGASIYLKGATMDVSAATLTLGANTSLSITVAGYGADAQGTAALKLTAGQVATLAGTSGLQISLTGAVLSADWSFHLLDISGSGVSESDLKSIAGMITNSLDGYMLVLDTEGVLRLTAVVEPTDGVLVWNTGNMDWADGTQGWQTEAGDDTVFRPSRDVIFGVTGTEGGTVTLREEIVVGAMTVAYGNFEFALNGQTLSADSITVDSTMAVSGDGTLTTGSLSGGGEFIYRGGTLSLGDVTGFTGTMKIGASHQMDGDMTFGTGASVEVISGGVLNLGGNTLSADVTLNAGAYATQSLTMGNGTITGNLTLAGDSFVGVGSSAVIQGNVKGGAHILDIYGTKATINGTLENISAIRLQLCALTIEGDITANSISGDTFTLSGRGKGNDGNLTLSGDVSGINKFSVSGSKGYAIYIAFDGDLALTGETEFTAASSDTSEGASFNVNGTLSGDSGAVIKKLGNGSMNLGGDLSGYEGQVKVQAGTLNVNSDATFSGVELSGGTMAIAANKGLTLTNGLSSTGGTLSIGNNGQISLSGGTMNVSGVTTLTVGTGVSLSVNVAGYGADAQGTPVLTLTKAQLISLVANEVQITLTGAGSWENGSSLYLLSLSGEGTVDWEALNELISITDLAAGLEYAVGDDGILRITGDLPLEELVWTSGDGTWSESSTDAHWQTGSFTENADVVFGANSASSGTVTVGEGQMLSVGNMTVKGQFTFDLGANNMLLINGALTVKSGAKMTLCGDDDGWATMMGSELVVDGTLEIAAKDVAVMVTSLSGGEDAVIQFNFDTGNEVVNVVTDYTLPISSDDYHGIIEISNGILNLGEVVDQVKKVKVDGAGSLQVTADTSANARIELDSTANAALKVGDGVTVNATVDLLSDAAISSGGSVTLAGEVNAGGNTLALEDGDFSISGALNNVGTLKVGADSEVELQNETVTVGALSGAGEMSGGVSGTTLVISNGKGESSATAISGMSLSKTGDGKQTLSGNLTEIAGIDVQGGELTLSGATVRAQSISVGSGATLTAEKATWNSPGTSVTLRGGTFKNSKTVRDGEAVSIQLGTLEVSGQTAGSIAWSGGTGLQQMSFAKLTGQGDLRVAAMNRTSNEQYQRLVFESIENYHGTVSVSVVEGAASGYGTGGLYIGNVSQAANHAAVIDGPAIVRRGTGLSKSGDGTLSISSLKVYGDSRLTVSYDGGTFSVGELVLRADATLAYNSNKTGLLLWDVSALESLGESDTISLDLSDVDDALLEDWYDLGIVDAAGTYEEAESLKKWLHLQNIQGEYTLAWKAVNGEQRLHIALSDHVETGRQWDESWGEAAKNGPDAGQMSLREYNGGADLTLEGTTHAGTSRNIVRITGGTSDTAIVVGGARYQTESDIQSVEKDTWISMRVDAANGETAKYHMLVGGSSCEATAAENPSAKRDAGGFVGDSHIQMNGGEVDYIVGGNHVTNSAFYFTGSSYISVLAGSEVNGSIVGGSTLTKGSAADNDIYEFGGGDASASHIFIYEGLVGGRTDAPQIALGGEKGAAFAAVVGGNAWVQMPDGATHAEGMAPTFLGDSNIVIDLSDATSHRFEKEIVGGNYTAFTEAGSTGTDRSTIFEGDAYIRITAANTDQFTGGISGASRRASGGGGKTVFTGDTQVVITGGAYAEAIAGGMWFEETASGDHSAILSGDTSVTVNDGNLWRVVGGSYSLQGGAGAGEVQEGSSTVTINGGVFTSKGTDQMEIGFVAGGDFYRNNSGTSHERKARDGKGGDTSVVVNGGDFRSVHIVGGDYANASTPMGGTLNEMSTVINGKTSVSIGGAGQDVSIVGLVAGGSYLTDEGAGGSVEVKGGTSVTIGAQATLDYQDGHPQHKELAVVGGHVVIDSGSSTGGHSATVGGQTVITVESGAQIEGSIVGGSYANETPGANSLKSGKVTINLNGGTLTGNVYGGHYTESVSSPDALTIGDITINLDGTAMIGNLVGGGHRATVKDEKGASTQGNIVVNLSSGSLSGNVYAAGYDSAAEPGAAHTTTASTTVNIGSDFVFAGTDAVVVSGGYGRVSDNLSRGSITGDAVLNITAANASIRDNITFAHFNKVNTAADVTVSTELYVLRKGETDNLLTKSGAGTLSVGGLVMWDSTETKVEGYKGSLAIEAGALALTGSRTLTIAGSLTLSLDNRQRNDAASAWLRAGSGLISVEGLAVLDLTLGAATQLQLGSYYLVNGLAAEITQATLEDYFAYDLDALAALNDLYSYKLLVQDGCLILSVADKTLNDEWVWQGGQTGSNDMVWSDGVDGWNQEDQMQTPNGKDVVFDGVGVGTVLVQGEVTPRSVWVKRGSYEFTADSEGSGLNIGKDAPAESHSELTAGELVVGSGNAADVAELKLSLKNPFIGKAVMLSGGTLTLNHAEALNQSTQVVFSGGVLAYEAGAKGVADLSGQVVAADADSIARVRVEGPDITWGSSAASREMNSGLELVANRGVEKTGSGGFILSWNETADAELTGSIAALEGRLEYVLSAKGHTLRLGGAGTIQVGSVTAALSDSVAESEATVAFSFAAGQEGVLEIAKSFVGNGLAQIGSAADAADYVLSADNGEFAGVIRLVGDSAVDGGLVTAASVGALGGTGTTLSLAGRSLGFASAADAAVAVQEIAVEADTTTYVGGATVDAANAKVTLEAAVVTGSGTLANATGGFAHTLKGDMSGFTGVILAGAAGTGAGGESTWTLAGQGGADVQAQLAGSGKVILDFADVVRLTGRVGSDEPENNGVALENRGRKVVIADVDEDGQGKNTSTGKLVGEFYLGDEQTAGTWAGSSIDGCLELVHGALKTAITDKSTGSYLTVATANTKGSTLVDAGGTAGSMIDDIVIHAGGHLKGVNGPLTIGAKEGMTTVWLYLDAKNVGAAASNTSTNYLMDIAGGATVADVEGLALDLSTGGFVATLNSVLNSSGNAWLHIAHGGLTISPKDYRHLLATNDAGAYAGDSMLNLLYNLGFEVKDVQGGDIVLNGDVNEVYLVTGDEHSLPHKVDGYNVLSDYKATVVAADQTLELELAGAPATGTDYTAGGAVVNNLVGEEGSTFRITNTGDAKGSVTVILSNEIRDIHNTEGYEVRAQNTVFEGSLVGGQGVNLVKTGAGTLTIGSETTHTGGLTLDGGDVELRQGGLKLYGEKNSAHSLTFAWQGEAAEGEDRTALLSGGVTELDTIIEKNGRGGAIVLQDGAELLLKRNTTLAATGIRAGDAAGGTLSIGSGATLRLAGESGQLSGVAAEVQSGGALDLGTSVGNTLAGLKGSGTLAGKQGSEVSLTGSGEFSGVFNGAGTLTVARGAELVLKEATSVSDAHGSYWTVANNGSLTIDTTETKDTLWLGELTLGSGSTTTLLMDTDRSNSGCLLGGDNLTIEKGAKLVIESTGAKELSGSSVTLAEFGGSQEQLQIAAGDITLSGLAFLHSQAGDLYFDNGRLKLNLMQRTDNIFITSGMEKNARAGAELIWDVTDQRSAGWKHIQANPQGDLYGLADAVRAAYEAGPDAMAGMASALAAAAGASTAALSSALSQDVQRQLNAIRNRSSMSEPANGTPAAPNFHLWLTGETSYHKMEADGFAPGYTLNGWGGSVGVDVDLSSRSSVGVALSAMYNDLKTSSADGGKGDMDTTYLSAYARTTRGAWTHTFVASVGTADVTLERSVSYGLLSGYKTHGSTDGYAAGMMYEVGYSYALNAAATTLVQPVFNVQYSHTSLSGYTETGSDAALRVDGMEQNALTLGLGARLQTAMGENAFNRVALFEARAMLKADLGDRSGTANTAFANAGHRVEVESAEVGAMGLEVGVGFSLPLGQRSGAIFMDGTAEFRSGYSSFSASAGYRINF